MPTRIRIGAKRTPRAKPRGNTAREPWTAAVDAYFCGGSEGGEIAVNGSILIKTKRPEEDGNVARDSTAWLDVDGAKDDDDVARDVSLDVEGAESASDVAGSLVFEDIDGRKEADVIGVTGPRLRCWSNGKEECGKENESGHR